MSWLHSVYFLDQNRGWVVGSNGTLLHTTDGGEVWKKLATLTKDTLNDVYFADDKVGWILAERDLLEINSNDEPRSYLMKTEDGGLTWRRVLLNTAEVNPLLLRFIFADASRALVFGESGLVFGTRDGGAHWTRTGVSTAHLLLGGTYLDDGHAWLVGAAGTITQTSNGGTTWQNGSVRNGASARFNAASFAGVNLGWAVGNAGQIFTSHDGGHTWYRQESNVDADLLDVRFLNGAEGWAAGAAGVLLHTTDAGAHWMLESNGTSHALQRLFFVDRDHGWVVGFGGTILKYSDSSSLKKNVPALSPK